MYQIVKFLYSVQKQSVVSINLYDPSCSMQVVFQKYPNDTNIVYPHVILGYREIGAIL